jgi:folate-dependent phosphoribosylglycinamide formyltransferase PurN
MYEKRSELVGTTVHLVDTGIDTGNIIEQAHFTVDNSDTFATYPYLQTAVGIPVLVRAVENALGGNLKSIAEANSLDSKLRYHPTVWQYLYGRWIKGVR